MSPWLTLSLAVVFVSFGSILVRLAAAPPLAVSFYRVAIASLILLPFAAPQARRSWPALDRRRRLLVVVAGLALALHFATWIASLSYTTVASSVLLVNTAPLFAIVLSRLLLREEPSRTVLVAIPVAFTGAGLIAFGDWTGSPRRKRPTVGAGNERSDLFTRPWPPIVGTMARAVKTSQVRGG